MIHFKKNGLLALSKLSQDERAAVTAFLWHGRLTFSRALRAAEEAGELQPWEEGHRKARTYHMACLSAVDHLLSQVKAVELARAGLIEEGV